MTEKRKGEMTVAQIRVNVPDHTKSRGISWLGSLTARLGRGCQRWGYGAVSDCRTCTKQERSLRLLRAVRGCGEESARPWHKCCLRAGGKMGPEKGGGGYRTERLDAKGDLIYNRHTLAMVLISRLPSPPRDAIPPGSDRLCQSQPGSASLLEFVTKVKHIQLKLRFHVYQEENTSHTRPKRLEGSLQHTVRLGTTFLTSF